MLWLTMLVCVAAAVYAVAFASRTLTWYVAVIGGGGALLVAPLLLQPLPDTFVNGRRGLITFALRSLGLRMAGLKARQPSRAPDYSAALAVGTYFFAGDQVCSIAR